MVRSVSEGKTKPAALMGCPRRPAGFNWSGRLDLNQRPLAPQSHIVGLTPTYTDMHALDKHAEKREFAPGVAPTASHPQCENGRGFSHLLPKESGSPKVGRQWLTVEEVAKLLEVGRATVYRLIQERRLEHVRIANAVKVHVEQLREYVRRSIVPAG